MHATQAMTHFVPLAQDLDQDKVTPGVLGFIVFAVMALGVWQLMKSMSRHMNKVDFKENPEKPGDPATRTAQEPAKSGASNSVSPPSGD
jgi:hypothetical protein